MDRYSDVRLFRRGMALLSSVSCSGLENLVLLEGRSMFDALPVDAGR